MAQKRDKYFVYHSGIDKFYLRAAEENSDVNFSRDRYVQVKGSVVDFQGCRQCNKLQKDLDKEKKIHVDIDHIEGRATKIPTCDKCNKPIRTNINFRDDLGFLEGDSAQQMQNLDNYFKSPEIYKRSVTVIEIGAGTAQPLARKLGETFLKNDKYRCALIRINPVKERDSQFQDERKYFQ